jgi:hypothetical protein
MEDSVPTNLRGSAKFAFQFSMSLSNALSSSSFVRSKPVGLDKKINQSVRQVDGRGIEDLPVYGFLHATENDTEPD